MLALVLGRFDGYGRTISLLMGPALRYREEISEGKRLGSRVWVLSAFSGSEFYDHSLGVQGAQILDW